MPNSTLSKPLVPSSTLLANPLPASTLSVASTTANAGGANIVISVTNVLIKNVPVAVLAKTTQGHRVAESGETLRSPRMSTILFTSVC